MKKNNRTPLALLAAAAAVAGLSFAGASALADHHEESEKSSMNKDGKDIVATAKGNQQLSTLVKAVTAAELAETLQGDGPFTVFAPTNEAFEKLPSGTLDSLLKPEAKQQLQQVLLYHVVSGEVMASDVTNLDEAETVQGGAIRINAEGGNVTLNDNVKVIKTDIKASNGVVHVIDGVLLPDNAGADMDGKEGMQRIDEQEVEDEMDMDDM